MHTYRKCTIKIKCTLYNRHYYYYRNWKTVSKSVSSPHPHQDTELEFPSCYRYNGPGRCPHPKPQNLCIRYLTW